MEGRRRGHDIEIEMIAANIVRKQLRQEPPIQLESGRRLGRDVDTSREVPGFERAQQVRPFREHPPAKVETNDQGGDVKGYLGRRGLGRADAQIADRDFAQEGRLHLPDLRSKVVLLRRPKDPKANAVRDHEGSAKRVEPAQREHNQEEEDETLAKRHRTESLTIPIRLATAPEKWLAPAAAGEIFPATRA